MEMSRSVMCGRGPRDTGIIWGRKRRASNTGGRPPSQWSIAMTGQLQRPDRLPIQDQFLLRRRLARFSSLTRAASRDVNGSAIHGIPPLPYVMLFEPLLTVRLRPATGPCESTYPIEAQPRNSQAAESSIRLTKGARASQDHSAVQHTPCTNAINFCSSSTPIPHHLLSVTTLTAADIPGI